MKTRYPTYTCPLRPRCIEHPSPRSARHAMRDLYIAAPREKSDIQRLTDCRVRLTKFGRNKNLTESRRRESEFTKYAIAMRRRAIDKMDPAFKGFHKRRGTSQMPGYRGYKDVSRFKTFGVLGKGGWKDEGDRAAIKGTRAIRFEKYRELPAEPKPWTITEKAGKWFLSQTFDAPRSETQPKGGPVGLDKWATNLIATSAGDRFHTWCGKEFDGEIRILDRGLKLANPGSERRKKTMSQCAWKRRKRANGRKDILHKITASISREHSVVVVAKPRVKNMTKSAKRTLKASGANVATKREMNGPLRRAKPGSSSTLPRFKCLLNGGNYIEVDTGAPREDATNAGETRRRTRWRSGFAASSAGAMPTMTGTPPSTFRFAGTVMLPGHKTWSAGPCVRPAGLQCPTLVGIVGKPQIQMLQEVGNGRSR